MNSPSPLTIVAFGAVGWMALSNIFFYEGATLAAKRRWHPTMMAATTLALLVFSVLVLNGWFGRLLAGSLILLRFWWVMRRTRFCGSCGVTLRGRLSRTSRCPECSADPRQTPGVCRRCGYDLRATPDRCPECGMEVIPGAMERHS